MDFLKKHVVVGKQMITMCMGVTKWEIFLIWLYLIYPISFDIAFVIQFLFSTYLYTMIAKKFSKGIGFTIGLILLPTIFLLILAFGKSKYTKEEMI